MFRDSEGVAITPDKAIIGLLSPLTKFVNVEKSFNALWAPHTVAQAIEASFMAVAIEAR